jgi:hypothetical protein
VSKKALFPTLSALPFTTVSCAPRSGEVQMPMASNRLSPSPGDTSGGPTVSKQREAPVEVRTAPGPGREELC